MPKASACLSSVRHCASLWPGRAEIRSSETREKFFIASASAEQSAGIEQVNVSIIEMDGMTQQNAALVEQAAAAFQSLQDQAAELQRVVSIFKLAEGEEPVVVDAPAPAAVANRAVVVSQAKPQLKKPAQRPARAKAKAPAKEERAADAPASTAKKVAAAAASDDWEEF